MNRGGWVRVVVGEESEETEESVGGMERAAQQSVENNSGYGEVHLAA